MVIKYQEYIYVASITTILYIAQVDMERRRHADHLQDGGYNDIIKMCAYLEHKRGNK